MNTPSALSTGTLVVPALAPIGALAEAIRHSGVLLPSATAPTLPPPGSQLDATVLRMLGQQADAEGQPAWQVLTSLANRQSATPSDTGHLLILQLPMRLVTGQRLQLEVIQQTHPPVFRLLGLTSNSETAEPTSLSTSTTSARVQLSTTARVMQAASPAMPALPADAPALSGTEEILPSALAQKLAETVQQTRQTRISDRVTALMQHAAESSATVDPLPSQPSLPTALPASTALMPFEWQGPIWAGQTMQWTVRPDLPLDPSVHPDAPPPSSVSDWLTTLRLDLPMLGRVDAELRWSLHGVQIHLDTPTAISAQTLRPALTELHHTLRELGIRVAGMRLTTSGTDSPTSPHDTGRNPS